MVKSCISQQATHHQLPKATHWRVKSRDGICRCLTEVECERNQPDHESDREQTHSSFPRESKQQGPDYIELLFDSKRPQVEQWFRLRRIIEIPALAPQDEIREESCSTGDVFTELRELIREKHKPGKDETDRKDRD